MSEAGDALGFINQLDDRGDKELANLKLLPTEAREMLKRLEWMAEKKDFRCSICWRKNHHEPDCRLALWLGKVKG